LGADPDLANSAKPLLARSRWRMSHYVALQIADRLRWRASRRRTE
jgi:hypothetical protein